MARLSLLSLLLSSVCISYAFGQIVGNNVQYRPGQCLPGDKHKELACPEPEGPDYEYCFQWSDETCCTAEFTRELAVPQVTDIEGFVWNSCGNLSEQCEEFFKRVECFYRCSPHVAHWKGDFPSSLNNLPVCYDFCDEWFQACASDMTCATDWTQDFEYVNGVNKCRNTTCRSFSDIYTDGRGICEMLWGNSFIYSNYSTTDSDRQCMTPYWRVGQTNPNVAAIRNLFGDAVDTVTPAPCGARELASRFMPLLAVAVFLTVLVL